MEVRNMALGLPGIEAAREGLVIIGNAVTDAREDNTIFINFYNDGNFQKFVSQTKKGDLMNEQLNTLSNWIDEICNVIEDLKKESEIYLRQQELINNI